jgi:hypothetical protein
MQLTFVRWNLIIGHTCLEIWKDFRLKGTLL